MKKINELAGAICDAIIAYPGGWGADIPGWLREAIIVERLEEVRNDEPSGTDAEALAYLSTTAMAIPLDSDSYEIYMYVFTKTMRRWKKDTEIPPELISEEISEYNKGQLRHLKRWIYERREKFRKEKKA